MNQPTGTPLLQPSLDHAVDKVDLLYFIAESENLVNTTIKPKVANLRNLYDQMLDEATHT